MISDSEALSRGLDAVFDAPIPASTVDLERLLGDGRRLVRRRLRRRVAGAVSGLAAVALVVVFLPTAGATTTLPAAPAQSPAAPVTGAAPGRDPLTQSAAFGWLPPQDTVVSYEHNGVESDHSYGENDEAHGPRFADMVNLYVEQKPGVELNADTASMTRIDPVNGHRAYARTSTHASASGTPELGVDVVLQSPSGQWIQVSTGGLAEPVAVRIARSLVFTPAQRPLPIRLSGPLAASAASAAAELSLRQGALADAQVDVAVSRGVIAQISVLPGGGPTQHGPVTASENLDGLHISLTLNQNGDQGADFAGVPADSPASPLGSATAYLRYVSALGTDQADWTTDVFPAVGR
ncbi:hypothetical protein [Streptacidiphilus sp. P02-A3a]|uniref:hypothetical protein n=1 Tax=Streptacidiphilus sp. P02-A3a TaxID=2704468 RepID=UPI0015F8E96F|nr:hypothetical protein [Streptacidiphilus sp. P02-A3a]QMU71396.1 hypothetical protein GXP74_27350 [Streptacidiphilus sp. P02-A3a]